MYDGIFEDVEHVKEVLASHGHKLVDETLVFELLEDLKVREHVVKVLLGTRLRVNQNSLNNSGSSNSSSNSLDVPNERYRVDNSYLSNTVDDSNSSDDLEVLEDHVATTARRFERDNEAVDLTMDDNRSSPLSEKSNIQEIETKQENKSVIDLTNENMEVADGKFPNENLEDTIEIKNEDTDANNFATDSESEMDDYYRRRDMESEESEGFGESDDKVSLPASPALGVCQNFENQANNDASNPEQGENQMEEMLEENNNDPNNNLEDIEELEQNNGSSTIIKNLNIDKESIEERSVSPKPGCSKDSYYADTDFCMTESGAASDENQKFIAGKRPNAANIFEDEDFFVDKCVRLSATKIDQDVLTIQKILPRFTKAKILSVLLVNQEAINRVELAMWKLLPDEEPIPVFHPKRKHTEDDCPMPIKKCIQEPKALAKDSEPGSCGESSTMEVTAPIVKSGIIKPAILKISDTKTKIIKSSTFELNNARPVSPLATTIPRSKSNVLIKPSKLEHLNTQATQNTTASGAKISNSISNEPTNLGSRIDFKATTNDNGAKKPKQITPLVLTEVGKKSKESIESNIDNLVAHPKLSIPMEFASARREMDIILNYQHSQAPAAAREQHDLTKSNEQRTGAIPKKPVQVEASDKILKRENEIREAVREAVRVNSATIAEVQQKARCFLHKLGKASNHIANQPTQRQSKNLQIPYDQIALKSNNAASYERGQQAPSPTIQRSELNIRLEVPRATATSVSKDVNPPKIARGKTQIPRENKTANDLNVQIAQRVSNIQLQNPHLLERVLNNAKGPKVENRTQTQPYLQNPPSRVEQPLNVPAGANDLGAAEPVEVEILEIEKQEILPPQELFNPLINMFPDVDPNYIAELCTSAKTQNQRLESLVEVLLINGQNYPRIINPEPEPQDINPDTQYENLQGIFPDAHPEYLRGIAEQYYNNPEAMKNFVQAKLEKADYPTMAEHLKKIKITEQIKQYTADFSAEKFLEIFPDPFAHFENPKRVFPFNVIAFEFLKCHFRSNKINTITRAYRCPKHPFHTSLAAKSLEIIGPDMKSKRSDKQLLTEDIPLLQEFAFIRHKAEIESYIAAQKLKEKEEFERLKKRNRLLECQCCYDAECMPSKCSTCSEGHVFCISCIKTGSETKIGEGQTHFPCFVECKGEFTLPVLQKVLAPTTFSILIRKRQEEEVKAAGLDGLVSCPFCHFASIPPPEDKVFKCLNPECMKETCRLCKELNHVPLRCDEVTKGEEARRYLEEKMTEALVRKCYHCSRPFFKDEGCNKMTCPCGAMTCYICGEPVKDYKHFNGQGSDRSDLCPLWSDNNVLNAQTVRVVAQAAEKEILKKNPHLKIDAQSLMPSLPQASRGPHQDIANAHVLPVQARRV